MKILNTIVRFTAIIILAICIYSFLLGNDVFKGKFANESIAWYILAKGLFCSLGLYLLVSILEAIKNKKP